MSNNRRSKQFGDGQNQPHIGASRSQSGSQNYDQAPKPQRGNRGGGGGSRTSFVSELFGLGGGRPASDWKHGGSKKNRKKK